MVGVGEVARALASHKWWWVTLIVIALMALLARLGVWQLDRLEERRAANAQLLAAIESAPIDLNEDIDSYKSREPLEVSSELANRDVLATGEYDYENQRILLLQNWSGRAGIHLITPFLLEGSDYAVLVDRGWIPDAEYAAGHTFADKTGTQAIEGYLALTETLRRRTAESTVPVSIGAEVYRVDVGAIQEEIPYTLLPFYIKLNPPTGEIVELPIATAKEIDLSEGSHLSYAMQWFIFSLGLGIAYVIYIYRWLNTQSDSQYQA